jgi:hypothetical protein
MCIICNQLQFFLKTTCTGSLLQITLLNYQKLLQVMLTYYRLPYEITKTITSTVNLLQIVLQNYQKLVILIVNHTK